jgi:arginase family enzyme
MNAQTILCPLDWGSHVAGASRGAGYLAESARRLGLPGKTIEYQRENGPFAGSSLFHDVRRLCAAGIVPIILGGDHTLTAYSGAAAASVFPDLSIHHVDAHHDAYRGGSLNHYTVMRVLRGQGINVVSHGIRWETEKADAHVERTGTGPSYLSIDFDFFCPSHVPSVGHRVAASREGEPGHEELIRILAAVPRPVVCIDLVEWLGSSGNRDEDLFVERAVQLVVGVLR